MAVTYSGNHKALATAESDAWPEGDHAAGENTFVIELVLRGSSSDGPFAS